MFLKKGLLVAGLAAFFSNGFAGAVGSATGEFTMNQYYTASMPIYAVQDEISSGGWHEHHFCVCNVSTQTATTHAITWEFTNAAGTALATSALATTTLTDGVETASANTVGALGIIRDGDAVRLEVLNINDARSLASQAMAAGATYGTAASGPKPSFHLNETGAVSTNNFAYVWAALHQSSASITAAGTAGQDAAGTAIATTASTQALNFFEASNVTATTDVKKTFASWPVATVANSIHNLQAAMGTCNSGTSFDWAADAGQCGDHPVGSIVVHVPAYHKGGTYNLYFKLTSAEDTNANGTAGS